MNNFVFGSDPLLYSTTMPRQDYMSEPDIKRQLDSVMQQYQQLQQSKQSETPSQKDWIGEFDNLLKELDPSVAESIANDQEFAQLNALIQQDIQAEIMSTIKWRLNNKSDVTQRIKRAIDIVTYYQQNKANEDKKNISELNDYIQNYSDMTFNEYKKMKGSI